MRGIDSSYQRSLVFSSHLSHASIAVTRTLSTLFPFPYPCISFSLISSAYSTKSVASHAAIQVLTQQQDPGYHQPNHPPLHHFFEKFRNISCSNASSQATVSSSTLELELESAKEAESYVGSRLFCFIRIILTHH